MSEPMTAASRARFRSRHRRARRGFSLVLFAMLLFGLFALAALVIDIGLARVTQRQMQTAADSAALEGLRGNDAKAMVEFHFDDDLDSSNGDDGAFNSNSGQFGAGPLVEFTGGAGDASLAASQTLTVNAANSIYKPELLPGTPSPAGNFSIALERGATTIPEADWYSAGPAVPYLFARGSLANRELIQRGITVRATAATEFRSALSVGMPFGDVPGLAKFAMTLDGDGMPDTNTPIFFEHGVTSQMPLVVGRTLPPPITNVPPSHSGYAPLVANLSGSLAQRVIGFVYAELNDAGVVNLPIDLALQNASRNASVAICWKLPDGMTSAEIAEVFSENSKLRNGIAHLKAPRSLPLSNADNENP